MSILCPKMKNGYTIGQKVVLVKIMHKMKAISTPRFSTEVPKRSVHFMAKTMKKMFWAESKASSADTTQGGLRLKVSQCGKS